MLDTNLPLLLILPNFFFDVFQNCFSLIMSYIFHAWAEYYMMLKFCCDIVKSVRIADKNCDLYANVPGEIYQNEVFISFWSVLYINYNFFNYCSLKFRDRLKLQNEEVIDHLPHSLFRKYISYARKYVHPQLSDGAKSVLKQFYLELRKRYHIGDCTPITARQLESLKRLSEVI